MPELPEVETVVRDLRPRVCGQRIDAIKTSKLPLRREWSRNWNDAIVGSRIEEASRRGKWILFHLDSKAVLVFHLGMTGQLTVVPEMQSQLDHTHLIFNLGRAEQLRFRDIRRFGSVTLFHDSTALDEFFQASRLGPEPFQVDPSYWRERMRRTKRCVKNVLLDQQVVAGVGNIYADESLFEARLHPELAADRVNRQQAERLRVAIEKVLTRAIEKRGSTIRNYVGGSGLSGEFQQEFQAYGRNGKPCVRCGETISRIVIGGRSTHFCPRCQRIRNRS